MAGEEKVTLTFRAELADLRKQLATIPGITEGEAKRMAIALEKGLKKAESAAKDAAAQTRALGDAAKRAKEAEDAAGRAAEHLAGGVGRVGAGVARLSGALDLVVPGLGEMAQTGADLADVAESSAEGAAALGVSLRTLATIAAPVTAAVVALGLAWRSLRESEEAAMAAERAAADQADRVVGLTDQVTAAIRRRDVALGGDVATAAKAADINDAWSKALAEQLEPLRAQTAELEKRASAIYWLDKTATDDAVAAKAALASNLELQKQITTAVQAGRQADLDALDIADQRAAADAHAAANAAARAAAAAAAATKEEAAVYDLSAVLADYVEVQREATLVQDRQAEEAVAGWGREYAAIATAATQIERAMMGAAERVDVELAAELDRLARLAAAYSDDAQMLEQIERLKTDTIRQAEAEQTQIAEQEAARRGAIRAQELAAARQAATQIISAIGEVTSTWSDSTQAAATATRDALLQAGDDVTAAEKQALAERLRAEAEAARRAFRAHQVAALGEVAFNTAIGVSASSEYPWPYSALVAAAALATGAAQAGVILSQSPPTFHRGGVVQVAPDEQMIRARKGEGVLTSAAVDRIGRDAVHALNAGGSPMTGPTVVVQVLRHVPYDAFLRQDLRRPGGVLRSALDGLSGRAAYGQRVTA